jgi:hypothetical protein
VEATGYLDFRDCPSSLDRSLGYRLVYLACGPATRTFICEPAARTFGCLQFW